MGNVIQIFWFWSSLWTLEAGSVTQWTQCQTKGKTTGFTFWETEVGLDPGRLQQCLKNTRKKQSSWEVNLSKQTTISQKAFKWKRPTDVHFQKNKNHDKTLFKKKSTWISLTLSLLSNYIDSNHPSLLLHTVAAISCTISLIHIIILGAAEEMLK